MFDFRTTLKEIWPKVKRKHLYPQIPLPEFCDGEERVGIDIKDKRIKISKKFVLGMGGKLKPEEAIEGLIDHAVCHYLYCPWDFSTHLKLYRAAKNALKDADRSQKALDYFMDVVADTNCVMSCDTPIPQLYRNLSRGPLEKAVHSACQEMWGIDLAIEGNREIARKLSRLPYLDRSRWVDCMEKFAKIIEPLFEEVDPQSVDPNPMGSHSVQQYSRDEVEQGLKDLADDSDSPQEFREIIQDMAQDSATAELIKNSMGLGRGDPFDPDIYYYMNLAALYSLPVRRAPVTKSGNLYPHHHIPWEIGKPIAEVDPWTSFGKIMPGLTQSWYRCEGEISGRGEGVPDCLIIIDSSASMINPRYNLSYATLGASCACESYLRNGSSVAVYNFSDASDGDRHVLPYSRNRDDIYRAICHYFGGGTKILPENIETLQKKPLPDIFLITDMQMTDLAFFIKYLNGCDNRITAVHIGDNKHSGLFVKSMDLKRNVAIFPVNDRKDIPSIILGQVKDYFHI